LQCSGINKKQKAVVLARTQGELKFDTMSQSMRSCSTDFVVSRKKSIYTYLVEPKTILNEDEPSAAIPDDMDFQDVELFLAEYGGDDDTIDVTETYEAHEAHEITDILAVSWKEKRQELNKFRQARQFHKEADLKKTYRIEM
jgi:hypothetical protein